MPSTRNGHSGQETPTKEGKEAKAEGEDDSSASDEESSSYDEDEAEKRKVQCLDDMSLLEQQFVDLKEILYQERLIDVNDKIQQLSEDIAPEYMCPLKELEETRSSRVELAAFLHRCQMSSINHKYEQELLSADRDFSESCEVARDRMRSDIEEKTRRLQEEAVLLQMTKDISRKRKLKVSEFIFPEKRKKPVAVTGPCIVYMLKDMDIMEDLNAIRKGVAVAEVSWRKL